MTQVNNKKYAQLTPEPTGLITRKLRINSPSYSLVLY